MGVVVVVVGMEVVVVEVDGKVFVTGDVVGGEIDTELVAGNEVVVVDCVSIFVEGIGVVEDEDTTVVVCTVVLVSAIIRFGPLSTTKEAEFVEQV